MDYLARLLKSSGSPISAKYGQRTKWTGGVIYRSLLTTLYWTNHHRTPFSMGESCRAKLDKSDRWLETSRGILMSHWNNTIGHRNGVLMCAIFLLLKFSMENVHLKLVKDIPRTFQNSDFISGSLFGILINLRLHKIPGIIRNMDGVCTLRWKWNVLLHYYRGERSKVPHHISHPYHRWELPVPHYHKIMVIYLYPFLVVVTQFFSCIIFVNDCIFILTISSG